MDRYFIARNKGRLVIPSKEDAQKYGKPENPEAGVEHLIEKADLCCRLAKKRYKNASQKDLDLLAVSYMNLPVEQLKKMYDE